MQDNANNSSNPIPGMTSSSNFLQDDNFNTTQRPQEPTYSASVPPREPATNTVANDGMWASTTSASSGDTAGASVPHTPSFSSVPTPPPATPVQNNTSNSSLGDDLTSPSVTANTDNTTSTPTFTSQVQDTNNTATSDSSSFGPSLSDFGQNQPQAQTVSDTVVSPSPSSLPDLPTPPIMNTPVASSPMANDFSAPVGTDTSVDQPFSDAPVPPHDLPIGGETGGFPSSDTQSNSPVMNSTMSTSPQPTTDQFSQQPQVASDQFTNQPAPQVNTGTDQFVSTPSQDTTQTQQQTKAPQKTSMTQVIILIVILIVLAGLLGYYFFVLNG